MSVTKGHQYYDHAKYVGMMPRCQATVAGDDRKGRAAAAWAKRAKKVDVAVGFANRDRIIFLQTFLAIVRTTL